MRQYISNEKYELIKDNLDSKDTYVIVDGENVDKVAFRTNNITGQNAMYEIIPGATPTGTYNITENGEYDVTAYASAYVDVPSGGGVWEEKYNSLFNHTITYLDSTYIPSGSTVLQPGLCMKNSYLTSVDVPNATSIGDYAFYKCANLTYVNIPNVTNIDTNAFNECTGLTYVDLTNVTSIGNNAFDMCTGLSSVYLPNVTSIGGTSQFKSCVKLTTVDIGPNVADIANMAFYNCQSLTSFTCRATTPPALGFSVFNGTPPDLVIYVPAESVDAYKAATNWSAFASKIQAIAE